MSSCHAAPGNNGSTDLLRFGGQYSEGSRHCLSGDLADLRFKCSGTHRCVLKPEADQDYYNEKFSEFSTNMGRTWEVIGTKKHLG